MNNKKDKHSDCFGLIRLLKHIVFGFIVLTIAIIIGFLFYISRLSKQGYTDIDTNGVYNLVDSEGNIISTDLNNDDIKKIVEIINGKD